MNNLQLLQRGLGSRECRPWKRLARGVLPAAAFASTVLVLTLAWLWAQANLFDREMARLRRVEAARQRKALSGEAVLAEIQRRTDVAQEVLKRQEQRLVELRAMVRQDGQVLSDRMITPTVRIELDESVGSGTVIHVKRQADGCEAYLLTAYHVIEEACGEDGACGPIPIEFFNARGESVRKGTAALRLAAPDKDLALLVARLEGPPPACARLADAPFLKRIRTFDPVYTVGCPLGLAPLPSRGEITHLNRQVSGQTFWMTNAQMIFGNSGGGVYDAATQRMIGVSSRVCAYGRVVPAAVPHLGLMVPMETVHAWLAENSLSFLSGSEKEVEMASSK